MHRYRSGIQCARAAGNRNADADYQPETIFWETRWKMAFTEMQVGDQVIRYDRTRTERVYSTAKGREDYRSNRLARLCQNGVPARAMRPIPEPTVFKYHIHRFAFRKDQHLTGRTTEDVHAAVRVMLIANVRSLST
jgi:hypothetical protein